MLFWKPLKYSVSASTLPRVPRTRARGAPLERTSNTTVSDVCSRPVPVTLDAVNRLAVTSPGIIPPSCIRRRGKNPEISLFPLLMALSKPPNRLVALLLTTNSPFSKRAATLSPPPKPGILPPLASPPGTAAPGIDSPAIPSALSLRIWSAKLFTFDVVLTVSSPSFAISVVQKE